MTYCACHGVSKVRRTKNRCERSTDEGEDEDKTRKYEDKRREQKRKQD